MWNHELPNATPWFGLQILHGWIQDFCDEFDSLVTLISIFSMKDEILEVAGKIYKAGMSLLVIDTENKFVSTGFAKEVARVAQGWFTWTLNVLQSVKIVFQM